MRLDEGGTSIARMTGGRGRVGTWVRRILLGVAAVVALLLVGKLVLLGSLEWRTGRAATAAYEEQVEPGRQELADLATLLERDLGAPVTEAARGLACRVDHADAGWIVSFYYQTCSWRAIDYVAVDDLDAIVAAHGWETAADEECTPLDLPLQEEDERFARLTVRAYPAERAGTCRPPTLEEGSLGDSLRPTRAVVLDAVDPAALDPAQDWVVVTHEQEFFSKDLGCGIGLLCDAPMSEPAMPDLG